MSFKVYINQGEWAQICAWVLKHKKIETGGDLFGLWLDEQTAVVQFVLGPGEKCERTTTSFFQDVDYLHEAGTYLTKHHGICNGKQLPVKHGEFEFLDGNSPLRLNEKVLQNVHSGAEPGSFNQITRFGKEKKYIRNEEAIENLDISNENETSSYTLGNRVQHVTSVPSEEQKHTNRTAGKKTFENNTTSNVGTVQNTSQPIRHERHFNPQHVQTATPSRDNEGQLSNTAERSTQLSGQQKNAVVRVTSSETPILETTNNQKSNLVRAVPPNFNNWKHTNFGRGSMTSTTHGTDQEYRSDANRAFNSAESNLRAKQTGHNPATGNTFETEKICVARQVTAINQVNKQDISNQQGLLSLDQQKTLDQVSHGTTKATYASQKCAHTTVTYDGGHQTVVIHQPGAYARRDSDYDNVEKTEPTATPMDIDKTQTTITGHDVKRPDTPSGTIQNIASNDQVADSDGDEMMCLCGLFKKMKISDNDK
ncbi:Hypothetical predicted protein [Paramuricea clavata]|uniref:Uncharacterized protein n=1 Tax=Paramuricea clavata TaxID=317549 RepID=A0A7D9J542_PARCT|nr:Hypothetical predicted protein [Paramuricea clavata]